MTDPETEDSERTVREGLSLALAEVQSMSKREYLGMLADMVRNPPEAGVLIGFAVNISCAVFFLWLSVSVFSGVAALACAGIGLWCLWAIVKWALGLGDNE